jgi:autotransporter-associated beta strand protein
MVLDGGGTLAFTNPAALGLSPAVGQKPAYDQIVINGATMNYFGPANQNLGRPLTFQQNGATFQVSSSTNLLILNQTAVGSGGLTKTGPGTIVLSQTGDQYSGGTTVSNGTLQLTGAALGFGGVNLADNGVTMILTNNISLTNGIAVTGSGTTIYSLGTNACTLGGAWSGNGSVTVITTNSHVIFNSDLSGFGGTMSFGTSSGTFTFNNKTNSNPAIGSAAATFDLGTGSALLYNLNGAGLTYSLGALEGGANTTLSGRGTNSPAPLGTTYSIGANGLNTVFSGKIVDGLDSVSVVKVGAGSLFFDGVNTYSGSTVVSNGVFGGSGSITSPLTVTAGATLSPGDGIGSFTVNNTATLNGTVLMQLNQNTSDMLSVSGAITASGSLFVTNVGPDIINGTTFHLFNKAVTGLTDSLPPKDPAGTNAYVWTDHISIDGTITLASGGISINTNPTNIVTSVSGNLLSLSWPSDHTGWTLQAQTNGVNIGLSNNWVNVAGSSSTNMVNITINPANGVVFYRLFYQP